MKDLYEQELKKVFTSLCANYPHLYKNVNFSDLASDWYRTFTNSGIPADKIFKTYEEVIRYKADKNNDFGSVSALDMLAAYKRLTVNTLKNDFKCELCDNTGYVIAFDIQKHRDDVVPCTNSH